MQASSNLPVFPTETQNFAIPGPCGILEAHITIAREPKSQTARDSLAIICHPHPLHGGSMSNKVVTTLVRFYRDLGIDALRFNFRGVGSSEGEFANGIGELEDLEAVFAWARAQRPQTKIHLAGFSFGSFISAKFADQDSVASLISVAPPVHHCDFQLLNNIACPWIVIQGDEDEVVPAEQVYAWIEQAEPQPKLLRINAAGHFFHGKLLDLRNLLQDELEYMGL